jgi:hypothetical protein
MRQLGDIHRNPSRIILAEQLGCGTMACELLLFDLRDQRLQGF